MSRASGSHGPTFGGDGTTAISQNMQRLPEKRLGRSVTYRIYYLFLVKATQDLKLCPERRVVEVMHVA